MAKNHKARKFDRTSTHRDAMIRNLAISLVHFEVIKTTVAKARVASTYFEKMINRAKKGDENAKRYLESITTDKVAIQKIAEVLVPRYANRVGGYVSIKRIGIRPTDSSHMVEMSLVDGKKVLHIPNLKRQAKNAATLKRAAAKKAAAPKAEKAKAVSEKAKPATKTAVKPKTTKAATVKASSTKEESKPEKAEEGKQSFTDRLGKFLGLKNRSNIRPEDEK